MIISHSRKFVILKNHKTATTAINFALRNSSLIDPSIDFVDQSPLEDLSILGPYTRGFSVSPVFVGDALLASIIGGLLTEDQINEYDIYVFWRDPIDRFISGGAFLKRVMFSALKQAFPEKFDQWEARNLVDYSSLPQEQKQAIESISLKDIAIHEGLIHPGKGYMAYTTFRKQYDFFKDPRINILSYSNLQNEIDALFIKHGETPVQLQKFKDKIRLETDILDSETEAFLRTHYADDYSLPITTIIKNSS